MKILITGGAGFIGKYVARSLLEKNNIVTIFDNFSNSDRNSTKSLVKIGAKIIEGDITNSSEIQNAIKDQDIIIHLAAKISVSESKINPSETFRINVDGTLNILNACKKNNVKKLIVASSAAVYGEGDPTKKTIEKTETKPISPYGESKVRMEHKVKEFASNSDLKCVILRFFNIYGIGQSDEYSGVITKFLKKIKQQQNLEIFGSGMQTRDFVSIEDVTNSIHNAISYKNSGTFNIASGETITINELAEKMISQSKKNIEIKYLEPKTEDIVFSQANIDLAKKNLGYKPKIRLYEGIKNILD